MALGARGTTLIMGSGDGGVSGAEVSKYQRSVHTFTSMFLSYSQMILARSSYLLSLEDVLTLHRLAEHILSILSYQQTLAVGVWSTG